MRRLGEWVLRMRQTIQQSKTNFQRQYLSYADHTKIEAFDVRKVAVGDTKIVNSLAPA